MTNRRPETAATGPWVKSSYSAPDNECVEVAPAHHGILVRDSKILGGSRVYFVTAAFSAFVRGLHRTDGKYLANQVSSISF